jgi:hypothetical protein
MISKARIVESEETAVTRQRLGKHIPAATNTHATMEELLDMVFSVQSVLMLYNNDDYAVFNTGRYLWCGGSCCHQECSKKQYPECVPTCYNCDLKDGGIVTPIKLQRLQPHETGVAVQKESAEDRYGIIREKIFLQVHNI